MPTPGIIDRDPGHDDAMALLLALASPELELSAVTTVAGNQTLEKVTANAIRVLDVVQAHAIPVAAGADRALVHPARAAGEVHGETGLDGPDLPGPSRERERRHAIDLIAEKLRQRPHTLIPIGPLTNIALLLAVPPGVKAPNGGIGPGGGPQGVGNLPPRAGFNPGAGPGAAPPLFPGGPHIPKVGLDGPHRAMLSAA